jgi:CBS domain containing-hemolysin-like protein
LIGNLIYSQEILLEDVMTPHAVVFMLDEGCTVSDLIEAAGADAFSRIPLFAGDRRHVRGYVSHREVLKAYAKDAREPRHSCLSFTPSPHSPRASPWPRLSRKFWPSMKPLAW